MGRMIFTGISIYVCQHDVELVKSYYLTNLMSIKEFCQFSIVCYYTTVWHVVYRYR